MVARAGARALLGLGVGHGPPIGGTWGKPLAAMHGFLDGVGEVPPERLCLAALGPKMLELAAARTAGARPYMAMPQHTPGGTVPDLARDRTAWGALAALL